MNKKNEAAEAEERRKQEDKRMKEELDDYRLRIEELELEIRILDQEASNLKELTSQNQLYLSQMPR